jgi:hypothetical protein
VVLKAAYVVSGDKALISIKEYMGIKTSHPGGFFTFYSKR